MSALTQRAHKNLHKLGFYTRHFLSLAIPATWQRRWFERALADLERLPVEEVSAICRRVQYYNRLSEPFDPSEQSRRIDAFQREKSWSYYLDLLTLLRAFPGEYRFDHLFGDVKWVPERPALVKSRPIVSDNANAVLLKLNRVRHYYFVDDKVPFEAKHDQLVWRGACHQPHRQYFIQAFHDHPLCNVGDVHRKAQGMPWHRAFMSVPEQLNYKFILSIEGNDVATNLKWAMASNSLCFMTRPKFETWFMEGTLIPAYHYVELKDDYSDLEEKIHYYTHHPDEAKAIVRNANRYVAQFRNESRERLIGMLVLQKYFERSGQLSLPQRAYP
ncbi:glycosyl transferase family 90 [Halomonas faecis]|uniref:glycosyl transferase family 90 n=1 Tax=Halomonas faecis TaxID=1562110 RepID=UPI001F08CF1F|nr:glycosyl transferase family 90 [Halomonas faecis]